MCPYYLSIGMTYEQYWDSSPSLVSVYRKANKLKNIRRNEELWMQGMYIYEALSVVIGNAFGKKGSKKMNYPKEPYELYPKTKKEKKQETINERQKAINSLEALKINLQKKNVKETENVGNS